MDTHELDAVLAHLDDLHPTWASLIRQELAAAAQREAMLARYAMELGGDPEEYLEAHGAST
jgi:hypothetical protein